MYKRQASGREVNEDAMVLEMISKDFKGLFTGDIGMVTEEKLIQNGCIEDVDFLKTAHHGSRSVSYTHLISE